MKEKRKRRKGRKWRRKRKRRKIRRRSRRSRSGMRKIKRAHLRVERSILAAPSSVFGSSMGRNPETTTTKSMMFQAFLEEILFKKK